MTNNPYRPRTMLWALIEEDWSDLNLRQISEVFCTTYSVVYQAIMKIKKETGYDVKYAKMKRGRPRGDF